MEVAGTGVLNFLWIPLTQSGSKPSLAALKVILDPENRDPTRAPNSDTATSKGTRTRPAFPKVTSPKGYKEGGKKLMQHLWIVPYSGYFLRGAYFARRAQFANFEISKLN